MGLSNKDKRIFYYQLGMLVKAGAALNKAVELAGRHELTPRLAPIVGSLKNHIENGKSLADFMENNKSDFADYEKDVVHTGEKNGRLAEALEWLAQLYELIHERAGKRLTSFASLGALMIVLLTVWFIMALVVIPTFIMMYSDLDRIYRSLGGKLPSATQAFFNMNNWISSHYFIVIVFIVIAGIIIRAYGKYYPETLSLDLTYFPVIGKIWLNGEVEKFSLLMGKALVLGLPLPRAMEEGAEFVSHTYLKNRLKATASAVREGKALHETLGKIKRFPGNNLAFIKLGELNQSLEKAFLEIWETRSPYSDMSSAAIVAGWVGTTLLAAFVGFTVVAMYLPLFGL